MNEVKMQKVAAAIIEKNGKYLIAQRSKKDSLIGKWEFPGGKVEPGETLEEALKRELLEELSLEIIVGEPVCTIDFFHNEKPMQMIAFKIKSFLGNPKLNEHQAIQWVNPSEFANYAFPEPDLPIIELLSKPTN
jgi:mutator protein MutT